MIGDLKPHAAYKDSGQDWLGFIPAHWSLLRAKRLFREVDERSKTGEEELLSVSHLTGVTPRRLKTVTMFLAESNVGHKVCRPGDLVINTLWAWMAALGVTKHIGIVSPAYGVYRPTDEGGILPAYANHLLRTPLYAAEYQRRSTGVNSSRLRLYPEQFLRIPILVPPQDEQAAIVRFLDWANGRLERAIRAKRKVISLLLEQRQAIVRRGVTLGPNPAVPLKSSGIPWLVDIPDHWEVRPLKAVCRIQSGITLGKDYGGKQTREFPYLRVANVQAGFLSLSAMKKVAVPPDEARRSTLKTGDVLMTEGGDPDKLGRGCVWDGEIGECLHQNHVFAVRPVQSRLDPRFLAAQLGAHHAKAYFQSTAKQTTNLASTNKTKIGQLQVLLPALDEQIEILAAIEKESRPLVDGISRFEREIELLREYRTRLIADVVTGKLDVRDAAACLPDEAGLDIDAEPTEEFDEPELTDEETEA
ncbi:MAG: restriction endonuclease subunit S [Rhodoferax sp.]|nr:restriction endonuclease subunit S [Rhodoferax sp.]